MSNIITFELCAEDRARLDRLADALEALGPVHLVEGENRRWGSIEEMAAFAKAAHAESLPEPAPAEAAQETPTAPEAEEPTKNPPEEETPAQPEPEPAVAPVSEADLRAMTQQLIAAGKRDAVKAIVTAYAAKVSEIPEDKRPEVMAQLLALKEGKA